MLIRFRRLTAAVCLVTLVAGVTLPSFASAKESFINSSGSEANNITSPVMVDLLILRPAALITLCVSAVFFLVPVVPITLLTRPSEIAKPWEIMITNPAHFVWVDPLGSH